MYKGELSTDLAVPHLPSIEAFTEQVSAYTNDPNLVCNAQIVFLHQNASAMDSVADSLQETLPIRNKALQTARVAATVMRVQARLIGESCEPRNVSEALSEIFNSSVVVSQ